MLLSIVVAVFAQKHAAEDAHITQKSRSRRKVHCSGPAIFLPFFILSFFSRNIPPRNRLSSLLASFVMMQCKNAQHPKTPSHSLQYPFIQIFRFLLFFFSYISRPTFFFSFSRLARLHEAIFCAFSNLLTHEHPKNQQRKQKNVIWFLMM
jgi:hypothetical protein